MDKINKYFLIDLFIIMLLGVIMVYSSSYIYAKEVIGSSTHFLFKQLGFAVFGGVFAFIISKTKLSFWYKHIYIFNALAIVFLFLTLTPLGVQIKGSHRWLNLFGIGIQPGEFIKYTLMFAALKYFNSFDQYTTDQRMLYLAGLLTPLVLFVAQPDFGTFSISIVLMMFACFISDFNRKYFYGLVGLSLAGVLGILFMAPYRVKRVLTYLNPWDDPQNSGFQIIQSYLAFANGHFIGLGVGNSNEKLFYLPEAYNDFIFSVIGEELGLFGVLLVIFLFLVFIYLGFKLALAIERKVNSMFACCVVFAIGIQAFLNMAVVLGLLPTKGLNLPFISYGGSSLISNILLIGFFYSAQQIKSAISDDKFDENNYDHQDLFSRETSIRSF